MILTRPPGATPVSHRVGPDRPGGSPGAARRLPGQSPARRTAPAKWPAYIGDLPVHLRKRLSQIGHRWAGAAAWARSLAFTTLRNRPRGPHTERADSARFPVHRRRLAHVPGSGPPGRRTGVTALPQPPRAAGPGGDAPAAQVRSATGGFAAWPATPRETGNSPVP